jgi:hypothetical protein
LKKNKKKEPTLREVAEATLIEALRLKGPSVIHATRAVLVDIGEGRI